MPKVSVCVPAYNRRRYLGETLDSVLTQGFDDLEVVVSDNCSTDGTYELALEYAGRDPRVRVHQNPENLGAQENYLRVYALAAGEYRIYLPSDDLLLPGSLPRMVEALDANPRASMVTTPTLLVGEDSRPIANQAQVWNEPVVDADTVLPGVVLGCHMLTVQQNFVGQPPLHRASAMSHDDNARLSRRYDYAIDVGWWLHVLARGDAVYLLEPLRAHRKHEEQNSTGFDGNAGVLIDWGLLLEDFEAAFLTEAPAALQAWSSYVAKVGSYLNVVIRQRPELVRDAAYRKLADSLPLAVQRVEETVAQLTGRPALTAEAR